MGPAAGGGLSFVCVGSSSIPGRRRDVAAFLIPYARTHAIGDFYRGVHHASTAAGRRGFELPPWRTVLPLIPYALILWRADWRIESGLVRC
jgi:hypothetical protein